MKRNNKKGFTIVELVIVIAVIAILAAVLVPTFASLVNKANIATDVALAKNLNTALAMTTDDIDTFEDVLDALREGGFLVAYLNARTEGCYFVWDEGTEQVLLVDSNNEFEVLYSNKPDYSPIGDKWHLAISNKAKADAIIALNNGINVQMTIANTTELNNSINADGANTVYIDGSISTDDNNIVKLNNPDAITTIDLGASKVSGGSVNAAVEAIPFLTTAGTMNINGGVISAIGTFIDSDGKDMNAAVKAENGGTLNVDDTTFDLDKRASSIVVYTGASGQLKNVTIDAATSNNAINISGSSSLVNLVNCNVSVEYIAVQSTYGAKVIIDGGVYHATLSNLLCVNAEAATITVEDGTFNCDNTEKTFKFYNYTGNKIILKGGTFNNIAFEKLDEDTLFDMCNLSDCPNGVTIVKENGAWVITVK